MSEWWTYSLSDFLLFSPRVYYRLIELHNQALWPVQIPMVALGLGLLLLLVRRTTGSNRIIPAVLGALWLWIGWSFVWQRYTTINWAAAYVAPAFALQGLLLLWVGAVQGSLEFRPRTGAVRIIALGLFAFAVLVYPMLAPLLGRQWQAAEIFGIAPDPTALATLGMLALAPGRGRWAIFVVPALWCAISGATLWLLEGIDFFIPPLGALLALGISSAAAR
ncbi:MAG: DUF6064 family protein [Rhodospirillales bacterium]|nr:DUF6064 family protein [Rhodospirillales bacterium]